MHLETFLFIRRKATQGLQTLILSGLPRDTCCLAVVGLMLRRISNVFGVGTPDTSEVDTMGNSPGKSSKHLLHIRVKDEGGGHEEIMSEEDVRKRLKKHELVAQHREKVRALGDLRGKLAHYLRVLHELHDDYEQTTGSCPCCRYRDMEHMIERAIEDYQKVAYRRGSDVNVDVVDDVIKGVTDFMGSMRRLSFANDALNLVKLPYDEVVQELVRVEEDMSRAKRDAVREERRLKKLAKGYKALATVGVLCRYSLLEDLIEEATMDCLKEE